MFICLPSSALCLPFAAFLAKFTRRSLLASGEAGRVLSKNRTICDAFFLFAELRLICPRFIYSDHL
jgi:hypothetical protein